jgi:hypothetical protein
LASVLYGIRSMVGASKPAPDIAAGFKGHGSVLKVSFTLGIETDDAFCDRASPEDLGMKHVHWMMRCRRPPKLARSGLGFKDSLAHKVDASPFGVCFQRV